MPTVTYEARKLPPGSRAFVEPRGDELRMVCPLSELEPDGAARLTIATQRNIRKHQWARRSSSGLSLPGSGNGEERSGGLPYILYEVDDMDWDERVSIVDGIVGGVIYVLVVIDKNLCSADGAQYMTDAVAEHIADGRWSRGRSGLWLPE